MAVKVKTRYTESFRIPSRCAACGKAPAPGMKKVGNRGSWSSRVDRIIQIGFPLCEECAELDKRVSSRKALIQGLALLVSIGICSVVAFAGRGSYSYMVLGFLAGSVPFALVATFAHVCRTLGLTPDQRQRSRLVDAVRICYFKRPGLIFGRAGEIGFQFGVETFAKEFAQMNLGELT